MYALANGLIGFSSSTLRVRVTEIRSGYAWVVTADLRSAGVALTLDESQIVPLVDENKLVVEDWIKAAEIMNKFDGNATAKAVAGGVEITFSGDDMEVAEDDFIEIEPNPVALEMVRRAFQS